MALGEQIVFKLTSLNMLSNRSHVYGIDLDDDIISLTWSAGGGAVPPHSNELP